VPPLDARLHRACGEEVEAVRLVEIASCASGPIEMAVRPDDLLGVLVDHDDAVVPVVRDRDLAVRPTYR
jgi:hypothetical protein